jgi:hypothetical protein
MRVRNLFLTALAATFMLGAAAPAFADGDWRRHERHEWREREWREHEWREHEWREHHRWPNYGYYAYPGYYR